MNVRKNFSCDFCGKGKKTVMEYRLSRSPTNTDGKGLEVVLCCQAHTCQTRLWKTASFKN